MHVITERTLGPEDIFADTSDDLSLIATAFYNGLWAYDGWCVPCTIRYDTIPYATIR